jgi:hypothetical protein
MWEATAVPDGFAELIEWICEYGVPAVEFNPLHVSSEVYSSTDHRVVVISKWRSSPVELPAPPRNLLARPPHSWDFSPVDR